MYYNVSRCGFSIAVSYTHLMYYVFLCYVVFVSVREVYGFKYFRCKLGIREMCKMVMGNVYLISDRNQGSIFEF